MDNKRIPAFARLDLDGLVKSTSTAAFAVDGTCRVVACNNAAALMLGLAPGVTSTRRCYDLLDGHTPAGARLCSAECPPRRLASRDQPVISLGMRAPGSRHGTAPVELATMVLSPGNGDGPVLLHLIRPMHPPPATRGSQASPSNGRLLTARETEVLVRIAAGSSVKEVAFELSISLTTARTHVRHILRKLDVHRQVDAVLTARRLGLL